MKQPRDRFDDVARWLGVTIAPDQRALLMQYQDWLKTEAIPAGSVGPGEGDRLWDRHIADSLAYLCGIPPDASDVVDIGGGVGLPSIPIAILRPELSCVLVDRSEGRTRLARRAVRILGLTNVAVVRAEVSAVSETFDVVTFRASLPIGEAALVTQERTRPDGVGLFGVSRRTERPTIPSAPDGITFALSSEGAGVLDTPFWLLRMWPS